MEKFTDMETMTAGSKLFIVISFFCFVSVLSTGQEKRECNKISIDSKDNLFKAIDTHIDFFSAEDVILLVDCMLGDSLDVFRINGSRYPFELFYKKPDNFFYHRGNMVYLFTNGYGSQKDTVWLNNVFLTTIKNFGYTDAVVDWAKDSIVSTAGDWLITMIYDPLIKEYKVFNGEIVEERYCDEMLYPKTGKPKGVLVIEDLYIPVKREVRPQSILNYYLK